MSDPRYLTTQHKQLSTTLRLLREAGDDGIRTRALKVHDHRFSRDICTLRKMGYKITKKDLRNGEDTHIDFLYTLIEEPAVPGKVTWNTLDEYIAAARETYGEDFAERSKELLQKLSLNVVSRPRY